MKYMLPGPPPSQFSPFPSPSFFFLRRKKRKLLFRIHCRECSWTGNLFSPRFDTARPLVLLLTLAKHSDNYFCWFQIASSSRVWSQQFFFACWACPFRHPERSRGKDDGFFHFYPVALWHSLNGPLEAGNARERLRWEVDFWSQRKTELGHPHLKVPTRSNLFSCTPLLEAPHISPCVNTQHTQSPPPLHGRAWPPKDPARNLQSLFASCPMPSRARCLPGHPKPSVGLWEARMMVKMGCFLEKNF